MVLSTGHVSETTMKALETSHLPIITKEWSAEGAVVYVPSDQDVWNAVAKDNANMDIRMASLPSWNTPARTVAAGLCSTLMARKSKDWPSTTGDAMTVTIPVCFWCGDDMFDADKFPGSQVQRVVAGYGFCDDCKGACVGKIVCIEVDTPERTGNPPCIRKRR